MPKRLGAETSVNLLLVGLSTGTGDNPQAEGIPVLGGWTGGRGYGGKGDGGGSRGDGGRG